MQQNWILHAHSRHHDWSGAGALSVKSFCQGQAHYCVGEARYLVDNRSYLVLNGGQEYTVTVDTRTMTESFCVFFAPGFAEAVCYSLGAPVGELLDDPHGASAPLAFFQRTYPHDDLLSPALMKLRNGYRLRYADAVWVDEQFHRLMRQLLISQNCVRREIAQLAAARAKTTPGCSARVQMRRKVSCTRSSPAALSRTMLTTWRSLCARCGQRMFQTWLHLALGPAGTTRGWVVASLPVWDKTPDRDRRFM